MVIPKDNIFHSIGAVAAHYGISRSTIKRRIKDGTLKAYRFGPRSVRIKLSDAEAAFRSQD
ncbi:helix-turn-helix transcriptional regulator [Glutamicibacter nicotianae]|uniref:helix-turn-helix transcriptional regulator n=1 Tax=Glutamicibacter nicotianae TaxID=37929 RepID=UPI000EF8797D|nr:helix-turn-helix domain-containing protein [Glutamicibacter nicotianae]